MAILYISGYRQHSCCSVTQLCLFGTPWTVVHQDSLSFIIFWSLLKLMPTESMMPPNHLIHCHPLLLLPSIFPSIRVFFNELGFHIRQPNYGRRQWQSSPVLSPGKSHGQRSLVGCSLWGCKELDTTEASKHSMTLSPAVFSGPVPLPPCSVQFSSVAQSCPTLCDPMNHSTPGLPVHHQLPTHSNSRPSSQ